MLYKKILFNKFMIPFIVLFLVFTPFIVNAMDVIIVDPTPDTTAPVLTSLNISSNQASPENPVKITAEVNDKLSGVNRVYISYRKPNGSSKGASLYLNQTTNKYEGTISISTYDVAGEWVLSYLTLTDNKDNSGYVYDDNSNSSGQKFDLYPYKFTVSGVLIPPTTPEPTDKVAPVLNSITISDSQVSGPGTVKILADVSDDDTGVNSVSASYLKPSGRSYPLSLYFNSNSGKYEGSITIDHYDEIGDWKLNYLRLGDKAGNYRYIYDSALSPNSSEKQDFSNCKIHVEAITPDLIAPSLDDLGITLVQNTNNTALIKLFAEVSDYLSGVYTNSVYAVYVKPSGKTITVRFYKNITSGKYEASIPIDKYDELGTWKLRNISVKDNKDNSRTINNQQGIKSLNTWDFSPYYFTVRGVITIPPAVPSSIGLSSKAIVMEPGETKQLYATLNWSDNTSEDITSVSTGTKYTSSRPEEVSVDSSGKITVNANATPGLVTIQVSHSGLSEQIEITIPGAEKESYIIVNPISVSLSSGQTKQLNVVANLGDGSTIDVTNDLNTIYTSSNTSLVNVTKEGLISIPAEANTGSTSISINYNGLIAETMVTFTGPPIIKSISMTPATTDIKYGEKVQMSLRATMSDGTTKDITNGSTGTTYTTSDSAKATVDANGLVSISEEALSGEVIIKAFNSNQVTQSIININGVPQLTSMQITPNALTMLPGESTVLQVLALYSDETIKNVTSSNEGTMYTSSDPNRVIVDAEGKITIQDNAAAGTVTVTAKNGKYQKATVITIIKDISHEVKGLTISPGTVTLKTGGIQQLSVIATMGDGSQKDVTSSGEGTVYTSSAPARAMVDAEGEITILDNAVAGTVTVTAKNGMYQKATVITIIKDISQEVKGLAINPGTVTLKTGESQQLSVLATMGDGSQKDVTSSSKGTVYTSSAPARATVDTEGKITILDNATAGTVTVTAKNGMYQKATVITIVKDPSTIVKGLAITPGTVTLKTGEVQQLSVMATMGDGSQKDVTSSREGTVYTSSAPVRATVDAEGKITIQDNAAAGTVTVTAKNGMYQKATVITIVKDPSTIVKGLAITPGTVTLKTGEVQQLSVMATMGDGSQKDVTSSREGTVYTSSAPVRATVDAEGEITIQDNAAAGTVTVTAKNGMYQKATVITIVKDPSTIVKGLAITPGTVTLKTGEVQQLSVMATMGDGSQKDVTSGSEGTVYTSSAPARATVDTEGKITIQDNAAAGTVTVTAKNGMYQKATVITIVKNI